MADQFEDSAVSLEFFPPWSLLWCGRPKQVRVRMYRSEGQKRHCRVVYLGDSAAAEKPPIAPSPRRRRCLSAPPFLLPLSLSFSILRLNLWQHRRHPVGGRRLCGSGASKCGSGPTFPGSGVLSAGWASMLGPALWRRALGGYPYARASHLG